MSAPTDRAGVVHLMTRAAIEGTSTSMHGSMVDALAALEAAGLRVVPAQITDAMLNALQPWAVCSGYVCKGYEAMLAASPFAPQQETHADAPTTPHP